MIDAADIAVYVVLWFDDLQHGTTAADQNSDGVITSGDIALFVTRWLTAINSGGPC